MWRTHARRTIATPNRRWSASPTSGLTFAPNGKYLVAGVCATLGCSAGKLLMWDIGIAEWTARACRIAGPKSHTAEWAAYRRDTPYRNTCFDLSPELLPRRPKVGTLSCTSVGISVRSRIRQLGEGLSYWESVLHFQYPPPRQDHHTTLNVR